MTDSPDAAPVSGEPAQAVRPRRSLLASELALLFRRRRTWAMLAALAAIPVLIGVVVRVTSSSAPPGQGPAFLGRITDNGLFVGLTALIVSIPLFMPLTIGVVAGDTIAGEAGTGTLRYLLVAPAGRLRLLVVKYAGTAAFCISATLIVAIAGSVIGTVLFPIGPVPLLSGETISVPASILRLLLVAAFVTISLLGLSAIGLFISTLTTVPVGAMAATVVTAVVSQVLDSLPQLGWLHPWLFSHYWLKFGELLSSPISWDAFTANTLLQSGYIAMFGCLAFGRFSTRDVLS